MLAIILVRLQLGQATFYLAASVRARGRHENDGADLNLGHHAWDQMAVLH